MGYLIFALSLMFLSAAADMCAEYKKHGDIIYKKPRRCVYCENYK